jgi:hypothetical protein
VYSILLRESHKKGWLRRSRSLYKDNIKAGLTLHFSIWSGSG